MNKLTFSIFESQRTLTRHVVRIFWRCTSGYCVASLLDSASTEKHQPGFRGNHLRVILVTARLWSVALPAYLQLNSCVAFFCFLVVLWAETLRTSTSSADGSSMRRASCVQRGHTSAASCTSQVFSELVPRWFVIRGNKQRHPPPPHPTPPTPPQ